MRFPSVLWLLAGGLAAMTASAQQSLVCPPVAGQTCGAFHYHVQHYRPDTRAFAEVSGGVAYATQTACEQVRERQLFANTKVVEYFRDVKKQQYPADRFGPCHCDQTRERSSTTFLTDAQRDMQLRTGEEIRLRVRERLLDHKIPSDSELIRGLYAPGPSTPSLSMPKLMPLPAAVAVPPTISLDELRTARLAEPGPTAVVALNLPLIDLTSDGSGMTSAAGTPPPSPLSENVSESVSANVPEGLAESTAESVAPAGDELEETRVEPQPEVIETEPEAETGEEPDGQSPQETAERFISYETQRIQNVLRASSAIADENVKSKIFEACMDRIQLLSNLRLLIESSGARSRLAVAARAAQGEPDRLALVAGLFGERVTPHWAPGDAAEVVFEVDPEIANSPERALRDSTGRFTPEQKKSALYLILAETQPTEEQRLWLSTIVEGFLR